MRLRFEAEPHHLLIHTEGEDPVSGGQEFDADEDTAARLRAADIPVSEVKPTPAATARGSKSEKED